MSARLDLIALHQFLSSLVAAERALAEQYLRVQQRCDDADLAVSLATAGHDAERRADGVELLMADLGLASPTPELTPPVIAAAFNEAAPPHSDARLVRFYDVRSLYLAEQWRHAAVDCLRAVATAASNERIASAADFLDEESGARIDWLRGVMACFAAGALAPQLAGTPLPPHPERRPRLRPLPHPHDHDREFTRGPDATPV